MARLFTAGAEAGDATNDGVSLFSAVYTPAALSGNWSWLATETTSSSQRVTKSFTGAVNRKFLSARVKFDKDGSLWGVAGGADFLAIQDNSSGNVTAQVRLDATGKPMLFANAVQVGATGGTALLANTEYVMELGSEIGVGAVDYAELKIDGTSIASGTSLSITDNQSNLIVAGVLNAFPASTVLITYDDLILNDNTGSAPDNTFPGSIRIPAISAVPFAYRIPNKNVGPMALRHSFRQPNWFGSALATQLFLQNLIANDVVSTALMQKQINKDFSNTVSITPTIQKQINKVFTTTTVGITASLQKQINKLLPGNMTLTALMQRQTNKALSASTVTSTSSMQKQVNKLLSTTISITPSMVKLVLKNLSTNVGITASLQTLRVIVVNLLATVTSTASMQKTVSKSLTANVAITSTIQKLISKTLTTTSSITAFLTPVFHAAGSGAGAVVHRLRISLTRFGFQ